MPNVLSPTPENLRRAADELRAGGLVAFPTETVYGLGALADLPAAVLRVFETKGRPLGHPLIVHLPAGAELAAWAREVPQEALALAERFWPGPLTMVLERTERVADVVTGGQETVALRTPDHPVALALLRLVGSGVVAPSANKFGRVSPTRAEHVVAEFGDAVSVLDGGPCAVGIESTILDLSSLVGGGAPRLLRPGGVPVGVIEEFLGRHVQRRGVSAGGSVPRVSGSLPSHYAAKAPTRYLPFPELLEALEGLAGAAVLALTERPPGVHATWRTMPSDPAGYARALYAALRELDAGEPSLILIEEVPEVSGWLAVRDRLGRASATRS